MKRIKLQNSTAYLLVDDSNKNLEKYRWYLHSEGYARATIEGKRIFAHRLIMNTPANLYTDHINRDKLDNRKANLRTCEPRFNNVNIPAHKRNKSGYKGVSWFKRDKVWTAQICVKGKRINLGRFTDIKAAANRYNEEAIKYYGSYAFLNK